MLNRVLAIGLAFGVLAGAAACSTDDEAASGTEIVGGQCVVESGDQTISRAWNEAALDAIRADFPAPTVHARNLYHLSALLYDLWATAETTTATPVFASEAWRSDDVEAALDDALAFAAHRFLTHRYQLSLGRVETREALNSVLSDLCGVDDVDSFVETNPDSAAAFGVAAADQLIETTIDDGSLERRGYEDLNYQPINPPLDVASPGIELADPDRWQPLLLEVSLSQNGLPLPGGAQTFIGSNWGLVTPFAITVETQPPLDPGPPPRLADPSTTATYRAEAIEVIRASSELCVGAAQLDIGPAAFGDNPLGTDEGAGHANNPAAGGPYASNLVDSADYYRAIAEYWADGPTSETPPGHWNVLANAVSDALAPGTLRIGGTDDVVSRLEWDLKLGLALNGALHDAAIAAWGTKAAYDSSRPISTIRWMGQNGQASDAAGLSYHPDGLPLVDDLVEVITIESSAPGAPHEHLDDHIGKMAIRAWLGTPDNPETDVACVGWIAASEWMPYQRSTFVTPAFASYISGHSTFSRAGAEVLTGLTGSEFFPGGLMTHNVPAGSLLHEEGPSSDLVLNWATYFDASDEAGRSRIWGGIHIPSDDWAGRQVGSQVGQAALARSLELFAGS